MKLYLTGLLKTLLELGRDNDAVSNGTRWRGLSNLRNSNQH